MKRQSGFTLIELLLVLAIIGIISAIAIPALLSQRARARDKATISNMTGRMGDMIGQYDKAKEQGLTNTAITSALKKYLVDSSATDKNPWDASKNAFVAANLTSAGGGMTASAAATAASTLGTGIGSLGVVKFEIVYPGTSLPGYMIGACKVQNKVNDKLYVTKVSSVE
jgi:type IV pilus assembly protein PilA